jgi:hypothetical protein
MARPYIAVGDVGGVPEHDRGDDEVEAGGTKLLAPRHCVGNPALFADVVCRPCLKMQMTCARK